MKLQIDREELCADLAVIFEASDVRAGLGVLVRDEGFVANLLVGARQFGLLAELLHDPSVARSTGSRLRSLYRHSPLNVRLTTAFAREVTAILFLRAIAEAAAVAPMEAGVRERITGPLARVVAEQTRRPGALEEHAELLAKRRAALSEETCEALEYLEMLSEADYEFPACLAVAEAASALAGYAVPARNAASSRPSRIGSIPRSKGSRAPIAALGSVAKP
ncbi:MAG: hypothetical protein ACR2P8_13800 [Myxococcota bacterium]